MSFSSDIRHHLDLTITFPQVSKDGQVLAITENLMYEGTVPVTLFKAYDVSAYVIDMSNYDTEKYS